MLLFNRSGLIVFVGYVLRCLGEEKLFSDVDSRYLKNGAYSKIECRTNPTDSLETHSTEVLYKSSVFKS